MSEIDKAILGFIDDIFNDKKTSGQDLKDKLLSLILSGRPKKRELDMMTYGGCNPDFQYGYNTCLDEYDNWIKECLL